MVKRTETEKLGLTFNEWFWLHVKPGKSVNDCWEWQNAIGEARYGRVRKGGKDCGAHRVAYEIAHGEIPKEQHVLHTCDNPKCCNPKHLWLGTHKENMADMVSKGRHKGGMPGKINSSDLPIIAERRIGGEVVDCIARYFGASRASVYRAINRDKEAKTP